MKEYTFHNVTITLSAKNAEAAYALLCEILASTQYDSDTYTEHNGIVESEEKSTIGLWPVSQ